MKEKADAVEYRFILSKEKPPVHNLKPENAILAFLRAAGCEVRRPKTINSQGIYLDTFDWRLFRKDISLQFIKTGNQCFHELKSLENTGKAGKSESRNLRSATTENIREPWNVTDEKIKSEIADIISPRRLIEQMTVRMRQSVSHIIFPEGIQIEASFDSVLLETSRRDAFASARLMEISFFLKTGSPDAFKKWTADIAERFSLTPAKQAIVKMAIELLNIKFPAKNPPLELAVIKEDRIDTAVKKILAFQFHRLQENIPGALDDIDTEFVHQARVSTRKMRSLLRLSEKAIPRGSALYFTEELLWLGSLFGFVRDLDVFSLNLSKYTNDVEIAPRVSVEILHSQIHDERMRHLASLREAFASARWRIFSLRLSTFIARKPALHPLAPLALQTVEQIVPPMITDISRELTVRGNRILLKPKLKNFHKLRIQFKKIRYACEFFNQAFDNGLSSFIDDVVTIQDCLGELQDTVFTKELILGFLKKWRESVVDRKLLFMLGEIYQLQNETARIRQNEFYEIWKQFDREETRFSLSGALGIVIPHSVEEKGPEPESEA